MQVGVGAVHAAPVPQVHTPAVHALAVLPQLVQAPPSFPQALGKMPYWQASFWQHPVPQELAVQWQAPLTHCWPCGQAAWPPQLQAPPSQPSAARGSHPWHATPPVPQ